MHSILGQHFNILAISSSSLWSNGRLKSLIYRWSKQNENDCEQTNLNRLIFSFPLKESLQSKMAHAASSLASLSVRNLLILSTFRLWFRWKFPRKNAIDNRRLFYISARGLNQPLCPSYDACRCCCRWYGLHRRAFLSLYLLFAFLLFLSLFLHPIRCSISRSLWPYSMCDKYMCCVLMHTSAGVNNTRTVFVFFLFISAVCICNAFGPFTIDFVAILIQVKRSDLGYGGVRRCFLGRVIIFVRSERTVFLSTVYFQWLFRFSYILMRTHPNTSDAHTFRSCIQFIRLHASISFSWNTDHRNQ